MNGVVPALLAVLLAEIGPRAALYGDARRLATSAAVALCVCASALAGHSVAPLLTEWADAFLIALALVFAAIGQLQRVPAATGAIRVVLAFWRGGVALIAFAFASRYGALAAIGGAAAGMAVAVVATRLASSGGVPITPLRRAASAVLAVAAFVVAVQALRLT